MRSDIVKKGSTKAAHRSLFYAMGYTPEDLEKPLIGIVNGFNEIIPGHGHLKDVQPGDIISIDIPKRSLQLLVSEDELQKRRQAWVKPEPKVKTGYLARYAKLVTSANKGAV